MPTLKEALKQLWFEFTHSPNSPEGLRYRANALIQSGISPDNWIIRKLLSQAEAKERAGDLRGLDAHLKEEYLQAETLAKEIYPNDEKGRIELLEGYKKDQVRKHGRAYQEFEEVS